MGRSHASLLNARCSEGRAAFTTRSRSRHLRRCSFRCTAQSSKKKVVVVGGGWAGFGATKHLAEQGYDVTLIDAAANPGGLAAGWRTKDGRAVEAGIKGFWYQYRNTWALIDDLGIEWPFTDFTPSGFWNPNGLAIESPVFSRLPRFPTLLGQFVHTHPLFRNLSLADRATMFPLLYSLVDYDSSPETYERYDKMTARELFRQYGVSEALYNEFLKPLLLVGLFAPPQDISAAAMIGTMYFYTLAHQNDFDVCWCKGSVSERIFAPMVQRIKDRGGTVRGGQFVTDIKCDAVGLASEVVAKDAVSGQQTSYECDAVVFAVGVNAMQKLVRNCGVLSQREEFRRVMNLSSIDVISTRLWFDRRINTRFPSNVLSDFEPDVGATYFNLNELQDEYKDDDNGVIAMDMYHASSLLPLSDEALVSKLHSWLIRCEPAFATANIIDSAVLRFPQAVTHFSPGSYPNRPLQTTSFPNVFIAGDWVKGVPHGANGLSQERAYVTGLRAANMVIKECGVGTPALILDTEPDEPHIALSKQLNRQVKGLWDGLGLRSPFL